MTQIALDTQAARNSMVDGQLRPNRINDTRILNAMRQLPRERFLPARLAEMAYIDEDIKVTGDRYLIEPLVLASLVQLARPHKGDRALVIGAGTGYGAAVLAACGVAVTALESDPALLEIARAALPAVEAKVTLVEGKLEEGRPGPWNIVMIEGAVASIPARIAQLVEPNGGRLVTVIASSPGLGKGVLAEPVHAGGTDIVLSAQPFFDCATPYLPGFKPVAAFSF